MRAEVKHHLLLAAAEDHRVGERGATGNNLDGTSTSVVKSTPYEEPAVRVPGPVCDGAIYDGSPQPDENHHGNETTTLSNATDDNGGGDGAELHLVERVQQLRDQRRTRAGSTKHALETKLVEVADEAVCRGAERERVTPEVPLEGDDGGREHTRPNQGQSGLSARKTRVEEGQTGNHDHDHGRGHENVGLVTSIVPLVQVLSHCGERQYLIVKIPKTSGMYVVHARHVRGNNICGYLHESPPVISFVPLNSAGAPIHEYDMLTCSPGVSSCGQERVEVPWVKGG